MENISFTPKVFGMKNNITVTKGVNEQSKPNLKYIPHYSLLNFYSPELSLVKLLAD